MDSKIAVSKYRDFIVDFCLFWKYIGRYGEGRTLVSRNTMKKKKVKFRSRRIVCRRLTPRFMYTRFQISPPLRRPRSFTGVRTHSSYIYNRTGEHTDVAWDRVRRTHRSRTGFDFVRHVRHVRSAAVRSFSPLFFRTIFSPRTMCVQRFISYATIALPCVIEDRQRHGIVYQYTY